MLAMYPPDSVLVVPNGSQDIAKGSLLVSHIKTLAWLAENHPKRQPDLLSIAGEGPSEKKRNLRNISWDF